MEKNECDYENLNEMANESRLLYALLAKHEFQREKIALYISSSDAMTVNFIGRHSYSKLEQKC